MKGATFNGIPNFYLGIQVNGDKAENDDENSCVLPFSLAKACQEFQSALLVEVYAGLDFVLSNDISNVGGSR